MAQFSINRYIVRHSYMTRAIAIALASLLVVTLATIPFFRNASELNSKIGSRRKEAQELTDKVTILSGIDQATLDERVTILDRALPYKKDVVLYLSTIDGLSRELNLSFGGISLSPGEVTEASGSAEVQKQTIAQLGLQSLETEIEVQGTQDSIYSFLRLLEQSAPLMQIKDVKVNTLEGEDIFVLSLRLGMLWASTDTSQVKGQIALFDEKEENYFQQLESFRRFDLLGEIAGEVSLPATPKANLFAKPEVTPQQ